MKRFIFVMVAIAVAELSLAGCAWMEEIGLKKKAHEAILDYAENDGRQAVINFVDKCVAEGKFTEAQGERIKAALPQGFEALKKVMGEIEEEQKQEETK